MNDKENGAQLGVKVDEANGCSTVMQTNWGAPIANREDNSPAAELHRCRRRRVTDERAKRTIGQAAFWDVLH